MPATFGAIGIGDSGTGTQTPQIPAGVVTGSLSAMFQGISNNATRSAGGVTGGNGAWFNEVASANSNGTMYVDGKICTSDDPAPPNTYSVTGNAVQSGTMFACRFEGFDLSDPFGASNLNATTSATTAAVSLSSGNAPAGCCLVWVFKCQATTVSVTTPPTGFTSRIPGANNMHIATYDNWPGGATGSLTATMSGSSVHRTLLIAILPQPAATGTFTGSYDFAGGTFSGAAGPSQGTLSGGYDFAGSGFTGGAGPSQGNISGGYDFEGFSFVGVAGAPSSYGNFNGGYDYTATFTGVTPSDDDLIVVAGTEGGRRRFGGRK